MRLGRGKLATLIGAGSVIGVVLSATALQLPSGVTAAEVQREAHALEDEGPDRFVPRGGVAGPGVIEPRHGEIRVATRESGTLVRVFVREGDRVASGQPLFELDADAERAAVATTEAEVGAAREEVTRSRSGAKREDLEAMVAEASAADARVRLSETQTQRAEELHRAEAITREEVDRARAQLEIDRETKRASQSRLAAARAGKPQDVLVQERRLEVAIARRAEAQARLDRRTVRAPVTGTVLQLRFREGDFYGSEQGALALLADTTRLLARIDIDERDVALVAVGAPASVVIPSDPSHALPGTVLRVGQRMGRKNVRTDDPVERIDTKILEVEIELAQTEGLRPGLRVTGYIARP
jgi:HlyD family secretion protein